MGRTLSTAVHDAVAVATDVRNLAEWAILTALSLGSFVQLMIANAVLIAIVTAVGAVLVLIRLAFFASIPFLTDHTKTFVNLINIFIESFEVTENIVKAIILVVEDAISVLSGDGLDGDYEPTAFTSITYSQFSDAMATVQEECTQIDSVYAMVNAAVPPTTSPLLCPVLRAAYPLPGVPRLAESLSWWSVGADPGVGGNNCRSVPGDALEYFYLCNGIGVGYIVLEVLLPILLLTMFISSSGKDVLNVIRWYISLAKDLLVAASHSLTVLIGGIKAGIQAIITPSKTVGKTHTKHTLSL